MEYIRLEGLAPWDGRYELNLADEFTTREWGWLKRHSGYMPLTIVQGLEGADPELFSVFAAIALYRAGKLNQAEVAGFVERCQDVGFGTRIVFESDEQEDDAGPPAVSSSESSTISGDASQTSSERSGNGQNPTGIPASASSPSALATWAT